MVDRPVGGSPDRASDAFDDPLAGYREEFLQPTIGGAGTVAVLTRPLGMARPFGWLICHSFGIEQVHLRRLEVVAARRLAMAGFVVLRYHGQGYGDSELQERDVDLETHLQDAADAVGILRSVAEVDAVGAAGARMGGTVAALLAQRLALDAAALWQPVVAGESFVRHLLWTSAVGRFGGSGHAERHAQRDPYAEIAERGWIDVRGWRLRREAVEQLSAIDLGRDLDRPPPRMLLVGASRTGRPDADMERLRAALAASATICAWTTIRDPAAGELGGPPFRLAPGNATKLDTRLNLDHRIAETTAGWARTLPLASPNRTRNPGRHGGGGHATGGLRSKAVERAVFLPHGNEWLAAVLTLPAASSAGNGSAGLTLVGLLTGTGAPRGHRFGVWTRTARRLAEMGFASVRLDYAGMGDSTGTSRELNWSATAALRAQVQAALSALAAETGTGASDVIMVGNCLGAIVALDVAAHSPRCRAALAILPPVFEPTRAVAARRRAARAIRRPLRGAFRSGSRWGRATTALGRMMDASSRRAIPSLEEALTGALDHAEVCLLFGAADLPAGGSVAVELGCIAALVSPADRDRLEIRITPHGDLSGFESVEVQDRVIQATLEFVISHSSVGAGA